MYFLYIYKIYILRDIHIYIYKDIYKPTEVEGLKYEVTFSHTKFCCMF